MAVPITPGGYHLGATRRPLYPHRLLSFHHTPFSRAVALPARVDKSACTGPVFDQGNQGSCTANAHTLLFMALQKVSNQAVFVGSRAFNYWQARRREGDTADDTGANPQDNLASLVTEGLCADANMPYDQNVWNVAPTKQDLFNAAHHKLVGAVIVPQDLAHLKDALVRLPGFTLGIAVYPSFEYAPGGVIPMPAVRTETLLGFHDVYIDGYADNPADPGGGRFYGQNSWSASWGHNGRFTLPYAYVVDPTLAFTATSGSGVKV